jgi:hypothetical protein
MLWLHTKTPVVFNEYLDFLAIAWRLRQDELALVIPVYNNFPGETLKPYTLTRSGVENEKILIGLSSTSFPSGSLGLWRMSKSPKRAVG